MINPPKHVAGHDLPQTLAPIVIDEFDADAKRAAIASVTHEAATWPRCLSDVARLIEANWQKFTYDDIAIALSIPRRGGRRSATSASARASFVRADADAGDDAK